MDWFILQFVNTIYFKETNYIIFDNVLKENSIEYCEIIDREVYNGVQMQHMGVDFPQFIIDRLIEGCAVFLRLNHKYIPQSQQQYDLNHEGLITEYDGDSDCFTLWDFFNGQKYTKGKKAYSFYRNRRIRYVSAGADTSFSGLLSHRIR